MSYIYANGQIDWTVNVPARPDYVDCPVVRVRARTLADASQQRVDNTLWMMRVPPDVCMTQAVHAPPEVPQEYVPLYGSHITDHKRANFAGMLGAMCVRSPCAARCSVR